MEIVSLTIVVAMVVAMGWATMLLFRKTPVHPETSPEAQGAFDGQNQNGTSKGSKKKDKDQDHKKSAKAAKKATQKEQAVKEKEKDKYTHPWLLTTLKGHTDHITSLDLSPNNKLLASASLDRTVYIWVVNNFVDKAIKSFRVNIPFDTANLVRFIGTKAFIIAREVEKVLEIFKMGKKDEKDKEKDKDKEGSQIQAAIRWPQSPNTASGEVDFVGLGISCTGTFVMCATNDGSVELRDMKGAVIHRLSTGFSEIKTAKVSPCGRFFAVAGDTHINMYEVKKDSAGNIQEPTIKWNIPFGKHPIGDFAFSTDSSKLAVVRLDRHWSLYDTTGGRVNVETEGQPLEFDLSDVKIAITGDARVVGIVSSQSLYLFSAFSGKLLDKIEFVFRNDIGHIEFSADGRFVVTAGDNLIRIFQNVSWYRETVQTVKNQLADASCTGTMRKRLASELSSYEEVLQKF